MCGLKLFLFGCTIYFITQCSSPSKNSLNLSSNKSYFKTNYEIIFDQSYEQVYSPFDEGFSGMSMLCNFLRKNRYDVSVNFLSLKKILPAIEPSGKILFLGAAMYRRYSNDDLSAIDEFLKRGGSVIALAEHDNLFEFSDMQNELVKKYGIEIQATGAEGAGVTILERIWPKCVSEKLNISNIRVYYPAPLLLSASAKPLLQISNFALRSKKIIGAFDHTGKGKIAVIGDAEIFWNMSEGFGAHNPENLQFFLKLCNFLTDFENGKITERQIFVNRKNSNGDILFITESGSIINKSMSGFFSLAESLYNSGYNIFESEINNADANKKYKAVFLIAPFDKNRKFEVLPSAEKLIIIYDGQTDMLSVNKEFKELVETLLEAQLPENEIGINFLLKKYNVKIEAGTLIDGNSSNHFIINNDFEVKNSVLPAKKNKFVFMRSAILKYFEKIGEEDAERIIITNSKNNIWLDKSITPISKQYASRPFIKYIENEQNIENNVVFLNKQIFILCDMEPLSNTFLTENSELKKIVFDWLK